MVPSVLVPMPGVPPLKVFVLWHKGYVLTCDRNIDRGGHVVVLQGFHVLIKFGGGRKIVCLYHLRIAIRINGFNTAARFGIDTGEILKLNLLEAMESTISFSYYLNVFS